MQKNQYFAYNLMPQTIHFDWKKSDHGVEGELGSPLGSNYFFLAKIL